MKKIIAPIIITVIMVAYFIVYFSLLVWLIDILIVKLILGLIPLAFTVTMIYVCIQRINEIRSGEEDDLSKY